MIKNRKTATGTVILTSVVLLFMAMLMMIVPLEYAANAKSLTNDNNISVTRNTNCDSNACQTLSCINNDCHSNSSQVLNSNVPCYLPCLPAQPSSKSH